MTLQLRSYSFSSLQYRSDASSSQSDATVGVQVIFIDELDGLCRKRVSTEEEHVRRIKTEMLRQIENAIDSHIFLLCATNCPWELDSAFLRRFQKRVYVPLPDRL